MMILQAQGSQDQPMTGIDEAPPYGGNDIQAIISAQLDHHDALLRQSAQNQPQLPTSPSSHLQASLPNGVLPREASQDRISSETEEMDTDATPEAHESLVESRSLGPSGIYEAEPSRQQQAQSQNRNEPANESASGIFDCPKTTCSCDGQAISNWSRVSIVCIHVVRYDFDIGLRLATVF